MIDRTSAPVSTNRLAVISALAGMVCLASLCTALAPIPFTDWLCYPATGILALFALCTGVASLAQIKVRRERGRSYALVGVGIGSVTLVAALCAASLGVLIVSELLNLVHLYLKSTGGKAI